MLKNKLKKFNPGPITIMLFISFILMVLSFIFNKFGVKGILTDSQNFETSTVYVNNIFSKEGISYIIGSSLKNFRAIEPLVAIIVSLITVSILEVSGLLNHIFKPLKNIKSVILTFVTLFISIISTFIGDYSYAIIFPLVAAIYQITNKDSKVGLMTAFIGITMGYGTGLVFNYQDIRLGTLTEVAARNILDTYSFNRLSYLFIMIASTIILTIVGTIMIERKFPKKVKRIEEDELIVSGIALKSSLLAFVVMALILVWAIIPGFPFSGWLLGPSNLSYMERLFSSSSPFKDGILVILLCMSLICSYIYGKISRNIKDSREYNKAISKTFQNTGFIFAGLFFASIMINILNWTNISEVLSLKFIEIVGNSEMSGIFIIIITLLVCIIITILNPSTLTNWTMAAPVLVTSLARANIDPAFTQFIFKVGDSIGKCLSPFYIFFIVLLGFLYKTDSQNEDVSFFGTMKKMLPVVLVMSLAWVIILFGWTQIGLPIGVGTSTTM